MRRLAFLVSLAVLLAGIFSAPAFAEKRVALVIGNSTYRNVAPLDNPGNDAKLLAETLRGLGFTLVGGDAQLDLDKPSLDRAVQAFGAQLVGADVGLFYYAGHGVQVRGENYLIPVDANPTKEADVGFQMLDTNLVLLQMEGAGTRLNIVILDACRNNPFGGRSLAVGRVREGDSDRMRDAAGGLAQMQAPTGTLISFATQPGSVAQDGADGDSPYAKALALAMRRPGLDIFQTFNQVGLQVKRATGGAQQPWVSSSPIDGSFYFVAPPATPSIASPPPDQAAQAWAAVKDTTSLGVIEAFIARYGDSIYGDFARARRDELKNPQVAFVVPPLRPAAPPAAAPAQPAVVAPPAAPPSAASRCGSGAMTVSLSSRCAIPLSSAEERALKPKGSFKECDKCPEMVVAPAGRFTMGSPKNEPERDDGEGPQHQVTIGKAFAVGKFAVTFDEWDACVADGGCNGYRPSDNGWGRGRQPATNVSWDDAKAYVAWLSRKTGKGYRLLSEAEREYATRAGTTTPFWWGSAITPLQADYDGTSVYNKGAKGEYRQKTLPVDAFEPNPWGLYQVHGNVWDWVEDCWHDSYQGAPADGTAWTTGDCNGRVPRGGSWFNNPLDLRSAERSRNPAVLRNSTLGFRVGRTLTP